MMARKPRSHIGYYWVGTDVLNTSRDAAGGRDLRRFRAAAERGLHFADSDALRESLHALGVEAEVGWLPAPNAPSERSMAPLPEAFTVLTYVPDARADFYDGPTLAAVARELPQMRFRILAGQGAWLADKPDNIEFLGWQKEMPPFYEGSSCLVRLVEHDSVSCMVVEELAYGRPVIYSIPFPNAIHVAFQDASGLKNALEQLALAYRGGVVPEDSEGARWARSLADEERSYRAIGAMIQASAERAHG
jgi:glycosyltransferase involved in cell wall biosynthesis